MKKVLAWLLTLMMLIGMLPMGVFAIEGTQKVEVTHEHDYEAVVTDPTCTEQGYTTYTCACGDSYVEDYVEATGEHQWSNWAELVAPTCATEGKDQRTCAACGVAQYRDTRITGDANKILVSTAVTKEDLAGKKILLIGDSITAGVGTTKTYGAYLAESLGVVVTNKGSSGTGYCSGGAMATNKNLTEANVRNADIITIMLGVNDWNWAVKNGSWKGNPNYYDSSQTYYQLGDFNNPDTSTLYGALHAWCQNIRALQQVEGFANKPFIVITPMITSWNISLGKKDWNQDKLNIHGHVFREYCTAIMEVCAYYNIPVFDANMFSGIYYNSAEDNNVAETGGDGVHVNAAGHALLAASLEEFLLEGYTYETRVVEQSGHTYENDVCQDCRMPYIHTHAYTATVTAPTCTEQGYTTYTCACGDSYVEDYVEATGEHDFTDWYTTKEAAYNADGEESRDCKKCSHVEFRSVELEVVTYGNVGKGTPYTDDVTYTLYADGTMVISGKGIVYCSDWRGDYQPYKDYRTQVKTLIVEEGITTTAGGCFAHFYNLETVSLPDSLTKIDGNAFMSSFSSAITSIVIPKTVTYIGAYSYGFYYGKGGTTFTDVVIENPDVRLVDHKAVFNAGNNLANLTLYSYGTNNNVSAYAQKYGCKYVDLEAYKTGVYSGVEYMYYDGVLTLSAARSDAIIAGEDAPWNAEKNNIQKIVIESGITSIAANAFKDYYNLASIETNNEICSVGDGAFSTTETCDRALILALPRTVKCVGSEIFAGRTNVTLTAYLGSAAAEINTPGVKLDLKKQFKLLLIGNSYSEDASSCGQGMQDSQLLNMLQAMLGEDAEVTVALLSSGGKGINWHATQAEQGNAAYSFKIISSNSPTWTTIGSASSYQALIWTDWDVVSLQPYNISASTGIEAVAYPDGTDMKFRDLKTASEYLLDYIGTHAPDADIFCYMHWAQTTGTTLNANLSYYNRLAPHYLAMMEHEGTTTGTKYTSLIPVGLSIQNARSTYLALLTYNTDTTLNLTTDTQIGLQRDGGHLSFNVGRYIAGLTFAEMIVPEEWRVDDYVLPEIRITESVGKLPREYSAIAQKAVLAAVESWKNGSLAVTDIVGYTQDPTVDAGKTLEGISFALDCDTAEGLVAQLSAAVLAVLPADFAVDAVAFDEVRQAATVTIRFGYTSLVVNVSCSVADHAYTAAITAPTCTEQGYTTYTCACGDSYVDNYVEATGHTYQNGICTGCGEMHPNLANYNGKVISVLGDSISTFAGYIPVADGFNLEHLARYPQDNLLTDVNETWWMQVINQLGAKLGINDSWRGATVSGAHAVTTGSTGEKAAMHNLTRIQNLSSNGTPDVILFYGGTNDLAHVAKIGTFDADTAPTEVDLTTTKWDNLADGYVHTILRLKHYYPDAQIVCLLPTYTTSYYSDTKLAQGNAVLAAICDHYGVAYVDLRDCGITTADLPDGIHPDANGMDYITTAVLDVLQTECTVDSGEHIVHSVTHNLTAANSSQAHIKGVSHGKSFGAVITGESVTVTVTMAGVDITSWCYADTTITIPEVTGDVVITAVGKENPVYIDYLLSLPDVFCESVNLWPLLEHNKEYYTATGWGVHASGKVYSITIPVDNGNRIWATSFQKAGANGGTGNGIRLTWFDQKGVLKSLSTSSTYEEFLGNGYLTAPEGAVAVNVVMWNGDASNEVYILNREHVYDHDYDADCNGCGAVREVPLLPGDANGDGKVNNRDLGVLQQYLADMDAAIADYAVCDVNADGKLNNRDLGLLQQYLADMDVELHYGTMPSPQ